jgi:hypothetical protein
MYFFVFHLKVGTYNGKILLNMKLKKLTLSGRNFSTTLKLALIPWTYNNNSWYDHLFYNRCI